MSGFRPTETHKPPWKDQPGGPKERDGCSGLPYTQRHPRQLSSLLFLFAGVGRLYCCWLKLSRRQRLKKSCRCLHCIPQPQAAAYFGDGNRWQKYTGSSGFVLYQSQLLAVGHFWGLGKPGTGVGLWSLGQGRTCPHPPLFPGGRKDHPTLKDGVTWRWQAHRKHPHSTWQGQQPPRINQPQHSPEAEPSKGPGAALSQQIGRAGQRSAQKSQIHGLFDFHLFTNLNPSSFAYDITTHRTWKVDTTTAAEQNQATEISPYGFCARFYLVFPPTQKKITFAPYVNMHESIQSCNTSVSASGSVKPCLAAGAGREVTRVPRGLNQLKEPTETPSSTTQPGDAQAPCHTSHGELLRDGGGGTSGVASAQAATSCLRAVAWRCQWRRTSHSRQHSRTHAMLKPLQSTATATAVC